MRKSRKKAVAIAKDVIAQIKNLRLMEGTYFQGDVIVPPSVSDAQDLIGPITKKCTVCGIGACFISSIRLFDEMPIRRLRLHRLRPRFSDLPSELLSIDGDAIRSHLDRFFDGRDLRLIEAAFECSTGLAYRRGYPRIGLKEAERAQEFGERFESRRRRLVAIMENVVKHKGRFKV